MTLTVLHDGQERTEMGRTEIPRLAPVEREERTPEQQRLIERVGSELHIFTTLIRHPGLFDAFQKFAGRLLRRSELPDQDRETLILRTAFCCHADYEWAQHTVIASGVGVPQNVIDALAVEDPGAILSPDRALLVRAADQLALGHELDEATWHTLGERYTEQQMIELCMLVGNYAMIAGVLNSLKVSLEENQGPAPWKAERPIHRR